MFFVLKLLMDFVINPCVTGAYFSLPTFVMFGFSPLYVTTLSAC